MVGIPKSIWWYQVNFSVVACLGRRQGRGSRGDMLWGHGVLHNLQWKHLFCLCTPGRRRALQEVPFHLLSHVHQRHFQCQVHRTSDNSIETNFRNEETVSKKLFSSWCSEFCKQGEILKKKKGLGWYQLDKEKNVGNWRKVGVRNTIKNGKIQELFAVTDIFCESDPLHPPQEALCWLGPWR